MSNKNNNNDVLFSNQDTIVRREWIKSALESVRSRLHADREPDASAGAIEGAYSDASDGESSADANEQATAAAEDSPNRGLYVAWSSQERRSGT